MSRAPFKPQLKTVHDASKPAPAKAYVDWPEGARDLVLAIDAHTMELKETNLHLKTVADCASSTLGFFKKIVPWAVAAAAVLFPVVGEIVAKVSSVAGVGN